VVKEKQKTFWLVELKERLWPEISRYMGQEIVGNFQAAGAPNREKILQDMVQKLEAKPLQLPIESSWTNFLMNLVWPVIGPEFSAAMKDIIAPKLHNKLSFLAPITVEVDLGPVPPEFGEVEVLEDTEMGSFMDLKLHLHWHAKPKIVVTCKLGTVELPSMQLGCTFYFGFHNKVPEPPFFDAVCMYMGNAFMHARDVLGTDLAMDDPYLGMDFTHGWTGLDSRFVEDAIVGAVNGTFGPWMVLPQRVVMPMRDFPFSFDLGNPMPKGCLKLTVKGAHGLVGTEWKMASILTGSRSNDPYVTVDLGGTAERTLRTPTCYNTLEPAWKDHNSFFFVIDALRIQHLNFRIWDDGFMQQLREQHLGVASEGDEMARKLGVRVLDLFGVQSLDYFEREREAERTCELEQGWPGKEHPDPENGGTAKLELGLQWRPISHSVSAQLPPDVFLDDEEGSEEEEEEVRWPLFVLRVGVQHLEMRHFTGRRTDQFFARCTILPGLEPTGATCKEPQEGVSQRTSDRVVAAAHPVAQKSETVSRMSDGMLGQATKYATFEQSFRFFIRNAKPTKVHIAFYSSTDLKPEEELRIGEVTMELNSVLLQQDLIMEFKDEELTNWTGAACPRFSGQLQLWHINNMTPKKLATQASLTKTVSGRQKREAERFAFQASQLRAQAEALERKARACHSEGGRLARRLQAAESGLRVRIVSARGLRAADFNLMNWGTSDPFCTCEVVGQPGASFKTHVIDKCLDPCWDFEGKFPNYKVGSALKLTVYDQDWNYKNDFLGSATLEASKFHPNGFVGELKLENPEGLESYIQVKVSNLAGKFPASADDLADDASNVKVKIVGGKHLLEAYSGVLGRTACNLYCKCEIPGRPMASFTSQTVEHSEFPEWNYERRIAAYKPGDLLHFTIFNESRGSKDLALATCKVASDMFHPGGFAGTVELQVADEPGWAPNAAPLRQLKQQIETSEQKPVLELRIPDSAGRYPKTAAAESSKLQVRILSGRGLKASDSYLVGEATSDPYCTCEVQGRATSRFRSQTIERSLAPQWNYQHRVRGYQEGDALKFTVYDEDYMSEDDFLGSAVLEAKAFREKGFVGELRLDTGDEKDQSFIKVAVSDREGNFSEPLDLGAKVVLEAGGLLRQLGSLLCSRVCGVL